MSMSWRTDDQDHLSIIEKHQEEWPWVPRSTIYKDILSQMPLGLGNKMTAHTRYAHRAWI